MGGKAESQGEETSKVIQQRDRLRTQFSCVSQWLDLLEDGTNLQPYFKDHKCSRLAVYGAAEIGRLLLKEIQRGDGAEVLYFLDKNAERQREKWGVPVYLPEEFAGLPQVDMVVVTAVSYIESIQNVLLQIRPEVPVVSLERIISTRKEEVWYNGR